MFNNHLMKACLAALFAIGLAACSSSSDTATETPPPDPGPTQEEQQLAALQQEIADLRAQLGLDADDDIGDSITALMAERDRLQQQINDAANAEERRRAEEAAAAMAATAAKLYAGISAQLGTDGTGVSDRFAAYNDAEDGINVTFGDGTTAGTAIPLSEDEDTMVAANHGWTGKRYADAPGGAMVEAYVYSNVVVPTMGKKFGSSAAVPNDNYEYQLNSDGALAFASLTAANVVLTGVTRTAGTETFKLPDPNPNNEQVITVSGSFHGVSGTYNCDTGAGRTDACTASVAAEGLSLTGAWTFTPSSAEARVMDSADYDYASYGWWIHKAANDGDFTASAFVDEKGTVAAATGLDDLNGTATYVGGAAGKYALASSTGGTNDAGHFTARATLQANFTTNTTETAISGTIDNFMGADGMSRDWSVKLNGSQIEDTGEIGNASASTGVDTVWTIGGTAADKSGQWTGTLRNNGDDNVPQVATGTFYTEYGTAGKMVGAFGANKQ